jgi:hypothetical protein
MLSDKLLDRGDGSTEGREIVAHQCRHDAHQRQPADLADACPGEWRQLAKCRHFVFAMKPFGCIVEHEDDAPLGRKRHARDHGRRRAAVVLTGVDDDAPIVETGDADAGSPATRKTAWRPC